MNYATYVFDCDGVLLRSNAGKTNAFYLAALPYGDEAAARIKHLHRTAGSISRRARWERFFAEILGREPAAGELEERIEATTLEVREASSQAALLPGVLAFLDRLGATGSKRVVISGIETGELDEIIREHRLGGYFEHVEGGPRVKGEVLRDALRAGKITEPAVYYGDTLDDYEAARSAGLDFVLVTGDSEWAERDVWAQEGHVGHIDTIADFRALEPPVPVGEGVRVDREGYVQIGEERLYVGATLAGATINVRAEGEPNAPD